MLRHHGHWFDSVGKGQAFDGEGVRGVSRGRNKSRRQSDRLEQEAEQKKKKNVIGIKCPDRVCGRVDSAKRAAFFRSPEKWEYMREGREERIKIENPLAFEQFQLLGVFGVGGMIGGCGGRPQRRFHS